MKTEQDPYKKTIESLKEEKLNWDFDDFLEKANQETAETPRPKIGNLSRKFWLAASVALLIGLGLLFQYGNKNTANAQDHFVKNEILKEKERFQQESSLAVNALADSVKVKKDSITADSATALEPMRERDIMDQILPRRGRLRKESKPRFAAVGEKTKNVQKSMINDDDYQSTFVIINGQRIENEQEAIDLTKYSFRILSENVSKTVAQTDVIHNFNNDY